MDGSRIRIWSQAGPGLLAGTTTEKGPYYACELFQLNPIEDQHGTTFSIQV